jgi:hypothetical protein
MTKYDRGIKRMVLYWHIKKGKEEGVGRFLGLLLISVRHLKLQVADRVVVWVVDCGHPLCFHGSEQDCFLGIESETWI